MQRKKSSFAQHQHALRHYFSPRRYSVLSSHLSHAAAARKSEKCATEHIKKSFKLKRWSDKQSSVVSVITIKLHAFHFECISSQSLETHASALSCLLNAGKYKKWKKFSHTHTDELPHLNLSYFFRALFGAFCVSLSANVCTIFVAPVQSASLDVVNGVHFASFACASKMTAKKKNKKKKIVAHSLFAFTLRSAHFVYAPLPIIHAVGTKKGMCGCRRKTGKSSEEEEEIKERE